jgi:hypothetical protein
MIGARIQGFAVFDPGSVAVAIARGANACFKGQTSDV